MATEEANVQNLHHGLAPETERRSPSVASTCSTLLSATVGLPPSSAIRNARQPRQVRLGQCVAFASGPNRGSKCTDVGVLRLHAGRLMFCAHGFLH